MTKQQFFSGYPFIFKKDNREYRYIHKHRKIYNNDNALSYYCGVGDYDSVSFNAHKTLFGVLHCVTVLYKDCKIIK